MSQLKITHYSYGEEQAIHNLVKKVYNEFVSHENTFEGNKLFYDWIIPENIANRQKPQNNLWLARVGNKLAGIIEIRNKNNISLLFVDKQYQGLGIATELFHAAQKECTKRDNSLNMFFVHASLCSVPFYKSLGFKVSGKAQKESGIYYVNMKLNFENKK